MELEKAKISVIDFVYPQKEEELYQKLKSITGRSDYAKEKSSSGFSSTFKPSFSFRKWTYDNLSNKNFESSCIHTIKCHQLELGIIVILSGTVSKELINSIWNNSGAPTNLGVAKSKLEKHWKENFQNSLPLIFANHQISKHPSYPITLSSSFVFFDNHEEILGDGCLNDFRLPSNIERIATFANERHEGTIHKLGYNPMVNMSVVKHNPNKITFIGKTDGNSHFGYGVTDFDNVRWNDKSTTGPTNEPLRHGRKFIERFLPLLQIMTISHDKNVYLNTLKKCIYNLSIDRQKISDGIREKELLDLMEVKSKFFNSYIKFLKYEKEIQDYLTKEKSTQKERQRNNAPYREHPIQSRGTDFKPIFSNFVQDLKFDINQNKKEYETLKERYQILSDQLSQDTNLLLSTRNTSLQSKISSLTNVLVFLTVVLMIISIIDITPKTFWNNVFELLLYIFFIIQF